MTQQLQDEMQGTESLQESSASTPEPTPSAPPVMREVQLNESDAAVCYANFCRVTGTPEELILDFGLNAQPFGELPSVAVKQRLVVNYFTAKRLFQALGMSIQRHETAFGVLETDVQKRVAPSLRRAAVPG
jgi:hypothetical protein